VASSAQETNKTRRLSRGDESQTGQALAHRYPVRFIGGGARSFAIGCGAVVHPAEKKQVGLLGDDRAISLFLMGEHESQKQKHPLDRREKACRQAQSYGAEAAQSERQQLSESDRTGPKTRSGRKLETQGYHVRSPRVMIS